MSRYLRDLFFIMVGLAVGNYGDTEAAFILAGLAIVVLFAADNLVEADDDRG